MLEKVESLGKGPALLLSIGYDNVAKNLCTTWVNAITGGTYSDYITMPGLDLLNIPNGYNLLAKFNNGNYIDYTRSEYSDGKCDLYFYIRKADGTVLRSVYYYCYHTINGNRNNLYIIGEVDKETKVLYLSALYLDKIAGSVGLRTCGLFKESCDPSSMYTLLEDNIRVNDPDPWSNAGYADIEGGKGELDISSDVITLPPPPIQYSETGLVQLYAPTIDELKNFSKYLWNGAFLDELIKLWNNPMDIVISLSLFPLNIPRKSVKRMVHAGNVITTVEMSLPESQYITLDCGTLKVEHFYNAYLDYEPYTKCEVFLPYIGVQTLSLDDIMNKEVNIQYRIDLISGLCVAFILCDGILLYSFNGICSSSIPVSMQSFSTIVQSAVNIATSGAKGVNSSSTSSEISAVNSIASNVMALKPDIIRSGNMNSNVGILGAQKPYFIFSVPRVCLSKKQNSNIGYPSFMNAPIKELKGFTVIEVIHLKNMSCTDVEKNEIVELLKEGVFV